MNDKTKVGFGGYRISNKSDEHYKALKSAVENGCSLIDTSSNYTDGESEVLIGKVLSESDKKPLIISKVGYIQGQNLEHAINFSKEIVEFNEHLKHSIHPDFIRDQLKRSLDRLSVDSIDVYLLHNPEYFLKIESNTKEEFYSRIKKAFECLEELVKEGKIKSYGISANTFIDPKDDKESVDLDIVYNLAKEINEDHSFKYIQFPLNLIELGALERQYNGLHLIERANELGVKAMINRPLNALTSQGLVRLANYDIDAKYTEDYAQNKFNELIRPLSDKWEAGKEEGDETLFEIAVMQQFTKIWDKQVSIDAVEQIFFGHFFNFVAQVWGGALTPEESQPFYELFDLGCIYARKNMNARAEEFKQQAISSGLLFESKENLSVMALEKYKTFGIDYILVGMKNVDYVEQLKKLF